MITAMTYSIVPCTDDKYPSGKADPSRVYLGWDLTSSCLRIQRITCSAPETVLPERRRQIKPCCRTSASIGDIVNMHTSCGRVAIEVAVLRRPLGFWRGADDSRDRRCTQ